MNEFVHHKSTWILALALTLSHGMASAAKSAPFRQSVLLEQKPVLLAKTADQDGVGAMQDASKQKTGKYYPDGHGHQIFFPLGDRSFADKVVMFEKGNPCAAPEYSDPKNALGPPDYKYDTGDSSPCVLTLGCGGKAIFGFSNNVLVDVKGPDLYIFEVGDDIEDMDVAISEDGRKWIELGKVNGGTAAIDINPYVLPGEVFHFVRIIDLKSHCEGPYPGADIDAVGAIGAGELVSLKSSFLFDYNESKLKPGAESTLHEAAVKLKQRPDAVVLVEGHSDNIGNNEYNQKLSLARAKAVQAYLVELEGLRSLKIETKGYGSSRPVAPNDTDGGREQNRRVEIIIMPEGVNSQPKESDSSKN